MTGASDLDRLAESEDPETQRAATWWLHQGPAIHDHDKPRR